MNYIIKWFSDPGKAALTAFCLPALALVISVGAKIANHRRNKRIAEIEESRERDRLLEQRKANLSAKLAGKYGYRLRDIYTFQIENTGQAKATNVKVTINGVPMSEHQAFKGDAIIDDVVMSNHPIFQDAKDRLLNVSIGPKSSVKYPVVICGYGPRWDVKITWTDDSGTPGFCQTDVTMV